MLHTCQFSLQTHMTYQTYYRKNLEFCMFCLIYGLEIQNYIKSNDVIIMTSPKFLPLTCPSHLHTKFQPHWTYTSLDMGP